MKFQLGEIRNMKDPLIKLLEKEIPIKSAWRLNKLVKAFDKELQDIEEFRIGLVKKLGTEEEGTDSIQVPETEMTQFVDEFNELLMAEVDIEFEPIDIDCFGDIELSAKEFLFIEKIFN